jgi:chromosome segregation ATPase
MRTAIISAMSSTDAWYKLTTKQQNALREYFSGADYSKLDGVFEKLREQGGAYLNVLLKIDSVQNSINNDSSKVVTTVGEENITKLNGALSTLQSTYDKVPTSLKDIDDIQSKLNEGYSFSYDEIEKLKAAHPELESAIKRTSEGWTIEKSAVDALRTSTLNLNTEFNAAQTAMTTIMNSEVAKRLEQYGIELTSIKSLADAYNAINNKNAEITKQEKAEGLPHVALGSLDQEAQDTILSVGKAQDTINKLKSQLKDIGSGKSISGGKADKSKSSSSKSTENTALKNAEAELNIVNRWDNLHLLI